MNEKQQQNQLEIKQQMQIEQLKNDSLNKHQQDNNINNHGEEAQAELLNGQIEMLQMNENEYHEYVQDVEEHSKKIINKIQNQSKNQVDQQMNNLKPIKNPVSPYMIFVKRWKTDNPGKKFSIQQLSQEWKNLTPSQKREFVDQYKRQKQLFDIYQNTVLANNPNPQTPQIQNKFFFPLHRIKCIMKQDKNYTPKVEAVAAMARATQYFGQYFLQQMKKIKEGKNRVDTEDLFNCINNNQSIFGFLQCLIEQYAESSKQITNSHKQKEQKHKKIENKVEIVSQKKPRVMKPLQPRKKIIQKGQMNLMDMFSKK